MKYKEVFRVSIHHSGEVVLVEDERYESLVKREQELIKQLADTQKHLEKARGALEEAYKVLPKVSDSRTNREKRTLAERIVELVQRLEEVKS